MNSIRSSTACVSKGATGRNPYQREKEPIQNQDLLELTGGQPMQSRAGAVSQGQNVY
jgi:hypothetical protein